MYSQIAWPGRRLRTAPRSCRGFETVVLLQATQRVLRAAQLYHERRAPLMVITGGKAANMPCTLAAPMRDLAVRLGVPADRIRLEETSLSTWENAERSEFTAET